jgi:hypothetical protein
MTLIPDGKDCEKLWAGPGYVHPAHAQTGGVVRSATGCHFPDFLKDKPKVQLPALQFWPDLSRDDCPLSPQILCNLRSKSFTGCASSSTLLP